MNFGPVPARGRFVIGVIDPRPVRKGRIVQVHAIHEDVAFDPATKSAVHSEVEGLAAWLGLEISGL